MGVLILAKRYWTTLIVSGIAFVTFLLVFYLYNLPIEPLFYAFGLTLLWGGLFSVLMQQRLWRRHRLLQQLQERTEINIEELPEAIDAIEVDYQELVRSIDDRRREAYSRTDHMLTDMTNYYSMWAHQIKTPIAAIRLLLESEDTNTNEEMAEQIFKIEQYVEMVLQYLRIGDMSSDLLIRECQLDEIVKQVVRKYRKMFIRKRISLDYQELRCTVLTDEKWLVFVLEQVISNALKYTNEGRISIYMDKRNEKMLVIEDTGIGVKGEDLPRVFEKGFTGFNGRADKKSTGIGLYLCKQIMEKLRHTITMESEPGVGTRIKLGLASDRLWVE